MEVKVMKESITRWADKATEEEKARLRGLWTQLTWFEKEFIPAVVKREWEKDDDN